MRLKALNKHTHMMYIEMEKFIQKKKARIIIFNHIIYFIKKGKKRQQQKTTKAIFYCQMLMYNKVYVNPVLNWANGCSRT